MFILNKIPPYFWKLVFALFFTLTLLPLLIPNTDSVKFVNTSEKFSTEFRKYNSINKCYEYIDNINHLSGKETSIDTIVYVNSVSNFFKERFYHGLSIYSFQDNWIAYLTSKLFWSHLSAIVDPDDILKHSEGLCSQQNIAFTELLKFKGITSRSVGLGTKEGPGHFLTEVLYNGSWHLYDIDVEPKWEVLQFNHLSIDSLIKNRGLLYAIYDNKLQKSHVDKIIKTVKYGNPNDFPAKKMLIFHKVTFFLTYLLPFIFFLLFIKSFYKNKIMSNIHKRVDSQEYLKEELVKQQ